MRINLYIDNEEYAHIKKMNKGYARDLIRKDMGTMRIDNKEVTKSMRITKSITDIYTCKKCGYILTANKCINKKCK